MPASTVHVVFGSSAAASLRDALQSVRRDDRVLALDDDLSFGPINPADPKLRDAWIEQELGYGDLFAARAEAFWAAALAPAERRIAWTSRRSGRDYAGFLEWLWRLGDQPCEIMDVTDLRFPGGARDGTPIPSGLVITPGLLGAPQIVAMGLLDRAEPLEPAAREKYREIWQRLRAENAPLRVLSEAGFSSAPITFYDEELLSYAAPTWRKVARIVGSALANQDEFYRCGDLLLAARVRALVGSGRLECQGDLSQMRFSEVRLPAAVQPSPA